MSLDEQLQRNIARRRKSQDWPWGSHLSSEKVAELQALGKDPSLKIRGLLEQIFKESCVYLDTLARDVRECKSVDEANNFSRWLQFSGVLSLLEMFASINPSFANLRTTAKDLTFECGEHFKGGRVAPKYASSDIAEIKRAVDFLISLHAKPANVVPVDSGEVQCLSQELQREEGLPTQQLGGR